jgi:hypothetical protein
MVPIDQWAAVVPRRHSRRRYSGARLSAEQTAALQAHCETFDPFPGARTVFIAEPPSDIFRGIVGSYGRIRGVPSVLVMIGDKGVAHYEAAAGYTGEAAVLEATRLGLGTCWVAGIFDRRKTQRMVDLSRSERIMAVSPVGVPDDGGRPVLEDTRPHSRKPLPEIAPGIDSGEWPMWAFEGVRLGRLAPSAINRQPWRFRRDDDRVVISVDREGGELTVPKRLDCGIAMLHFELGALTAGGVGGWEFLEGSDVAGYRLMPAEEGPDDGRS